MTDLPDALRAETPDAPPQTEPFLETTMTSTPDLATLRDALTAARPALTGEQQDAADALLVALTPRMDEPTWPGAVVMAACVEHTKPAMHVRRHADYSAWECRAYGASRWETLNDPRPLTPAERRKIGANVEQDRAESVIAELSRAVGHTNAVRVLDYLLGSGWTVPEGWAE